MRVLCRHGHFAFYPRNSSDIAKFSFTYGQDLVRERDYYTFEALEGAANYSLVGKPYLLFPATTAFEGEPWEVMRENNLVYNLTLNLVVPKFAILATATLNPNGFYFVAESALLQPGARMGLGRQVMSYSGEFIEAGFSLRVSEFSYE